MAFLNLDIPPGVFRNGTELQSNGRYYDCNLVRWKGRTLLPLGGWRPRSEEQVAGKARASAAWKDNSAITWLGVGTHTKLYVSDRAGLIFDITPFRNHGQLTAAVATTNTDATVTITDVSHGLSVGSQVEIYGASTVGGLDINGTWTVATVPTADSYTFEHGSTATATVSAGGGTFNYIYTNFLTDPFDTTNTDNTVTVNHTAHGLLVGEGVYFNATSAVGGLNMDGTWTVATVPNANSYTFEHTSAATSTVTGGGGSTEYSYDIPIGRADSDAEGGYGAGVYGSGGYGTPREDDSLVQDASVWSLDTWGEYLVGVRNDDGTLFEWQLNTAVRAKPITRAPTARSLVVTDERILMALAANSNPRRVIWSDQEDNTDWTSSDINQAGTFDIQTVGRVMCGRVVRGAVLILTDVDAHTATYTGDNSVYRFESVGDNCGVVSRGAVATFGGQAAWMTQAGFWRYNGYAEPLPCDVQDYVFSDINILQSSKIHATHNSQFFEITWFYCSKNSTEIDRYVTWNYVDGWWSIGSLSRLTGVDQGVFRYPVMIGSGGEIYEHEVGFDYNEASVFAETGPIQIGVGDNVVVANQYIPDEKTSGDVTVTFKVKPYPNGSEASYGPYEAGLPRGIRFTGRQMKVRYTGSELADWRVGVPRLEIARGGRR